MFGHDINLDLIPPRSAFQYEKYSERAFTGLAEQAPQIKLQLFTQAFIHLKQRLSLVRGGPVTPFLYQTGANLRFPTGL